ncbi:MAG: sulfate transporter CysZ [Pseudomonadota bacterium]
MDELLRGASYLPRALRLLPSPRLAGFVLVPLLVNVALFAGAVWWLYAQAGAWSEALGATLPGWLQWLTALLVPVLLLLAGVATLFTFTMVANFIGAPFNGVLAERVMQLQGHEVPALTRRSWWAEALLALSGEVRKLLWFVALALPFVLLFFVPVLNAAAPFAWLAFTAWMLAAEYVDYPLGAFGLGFVDQRRWLSVRRPVALGFGAATLAMTMIPVVNFLVMPTAVIGATLLALDEQATGVSSGPAFR